MQALNRRADFVSKLVGRRGAGVGRGWKPMGMT